MKRLIKKAIIDMILIEVIMDNLESFRYDPLFRPILDSVHHEGVDFLRIKHFTKNEFLCHKGHEVNHCLFILSGDLSVVNEFDNGKTYNFETISKGLMIGEMELAAASPYYSASVIANSNTTVVEVPNDIYQQWSNYPEFVKQSQQRLASMLCSISASHGETLVYNAHQLMLRFFIRSFEEQSLEVFTCQDTRDVIAEKTGLSLRSVNRAIKSLADQKLITISQGKVQLRDFQVKQMKDHL